MHQKVILIGPGNVGRTFIRQVINHDSLRLANHTNPTLIIGIAGVGKFLFDPYGLSENILKEIVKTGELPNDVEKIKSMDEILDRVIKAGLNGEIIFVDASSGKDEVKDFHLRVIENSDNRIVTSNKNPISLYDINIYKRLTKNLRYQYTTTVMAGSGIVRFLRGTRKTSDSIHSIIGMFSGTLGFITSEMEKGRLFSEIVQEAYNIGYTEPHPWDDLNGIDVARKLIILARAAGFYINLEDIEITPFISSEYGSIKNIDDFIKAIKDENNKFKTLIEKAKEKGNVLRYIASLENKNNVLKLFVGLKDVKKDSPIGRLFGPANLVEVITDIYNEKSPYILQSPGAGLEVTASSLRKDLLSFLPILENVSEEMCRYK